MVPNHEERCLLSLCPPCLYFCMPSVWRNQSDRAVHERKAGEKKRMSRCVNESSRVRTELDKERSLELKERELLESGVC